MLHTVINVKIVQTLVASNSVTIIELAKTKARSNTSFCFLPQFSKGDGGEAMGHVQGLDDPRGGS